MTDAPALNAADRVYAKWVNSATQAVVEAALEKVGEGLRDGSIKLADADPALLALLQSAFATSLGITFGDITAEEYAKAISAEKIAAHAALVGRLVRAEH